MTDNHFTFYKYHGAGNDFIMLDQRHQEAMDDPQIIQALCHRRFGIGADGLIRLVAHPDYDFEMHYYNADGGLGSMCGNGGRCVVLFAHHLGIVGSSCQFLAVDGLHQAGIPKQNWVELDIQPVKDYQVGEGYYFFDTGSPHHIQFVQDLPAYEVFQKGQQIRYSKLYQDGGTNVNFVEPHQQGIRVRTYERGVENETLACGTGVTAAAMAWSVQQARYGSVVVPVQAEGGQLEVRFERTSANHFQQVWLCGPATAVFKGQFDLEQFMTKVTPK